MKKGYLCIAIATWLFSSMEIALKLISGQFNPIQLTFSRFLAGGLVLLPLAIGTLRKRGLRLDGAALCAFAFLGLLGMTVAMSLYQMGVARVEASVVAVLFSSNPIFVTLFAFLLLKEPIHKNQVLGLALDICGILVIIRPWDLRLDPLGVLFVILSTLLFSLYSVCGKRQCAKFGALVVTCFGFLFGSGEMMLLSLLTHIPAVSAAMLRAGLPVFSNIPFFTGYTLTNLPVILYIFLGVTGLGFSCYFLAMEHTSAQQTSLVFFFKPALAPVLAALALHEQIPFHMVCGIVLILCGSMSSLLPGLMAARRQRLSAEK